MKHRLVCILFLLAWFFIFNTKKAQAQEFVMSSGSIGVCSGVWLDPGGITNYPNNANITQTLYSSIGQCVKITFTMFNVDWVGDTLYVYDGPNSTFPLIGKYIGTFIPPAITSTNGALTFVFKSNAATNKIGWSANISCVPCPTTAALPVSMISGSFNACSGSFLDPGGLGNYPLNQTYTTTIYSSTVGNNISLNFSSFNLGSGDQLLIYNGSSTAYPLLGTYTGTTIPGLITAMNGPLTIVFISDATGTSTGWSATVACTPLDANCGTCSGPGPPPANDNCIGAQNIGTLPLPAACPNGLAALKIISGTNLCATGNIPYTNQTACNGGGNMSSPSADVWYRFTISGPVLNISISGLDTPQIGLYSGATCSSLIPMGCAIGANGQLNTSFAGLNSGTYYLQVSGGSLADQCNFNLVLQNNNDCAGCVIQSNITATPPPVNGTYQPGQTVTFCYTITDYNQQGANFLHGVVPTFGSGWNMSTYTPSAPPPSCSNSGTWSWYPGTVYSSVNNVTAGPGWFFETNLGNSSNIVDGNPANNFGDNNQFNNCDWQYCWTITTDNAANCVQVQSLNIGINTYGDGESGSWISATCASDPVTTFRANLACCDSPTIVFNTVPCLYSTSGTATGKGHGVSPYTFVWKNSSNAIILTQTNIDSVATINNIAPGTYTLVVQDNNGCVNQVPFTINSNPAPINLTETHTNASCGSFNGSIDLSVSNGAAPYIYSWSNTATNEDLLNITSGIYTVTVNDANNCQAILTVNIVSSNGPVLSDTHVNATCNGATASIDLTVTGLGPFTYNWSNSATTQDINSLLANTYSVIVSDGNNCASSYGVTITNDSVPVISSIISNATCNSNTGSIDITINGGVLPYTFFWNNGSTNQNLDSIVTGLYQLTVTDNNGCSVTSIYNISTTSVATLTSSILNPGCGASTGIIDITVSGGLAPYQYMWNNGLATEDISNVAVGTYIITVTDANLCTVSLSTLLQNTNAAVLTTNLTDETCSNNNGQIDLLISGGTAPYIYLWNNGTTIEDLSLISAGYYTVTVTDANNCISIADANLINYAGPTTSISFVPAHCGLDNGSIDLQISGGTLPFTYTWDNGSTIEDLNNLASGGYNVTISDANLCNNFTFIYINAITPPAVNATSSDITCLNPGGDMQLSASFGSTPYQFLWSNGATTQHLVNVGANMYSVTLTDSYGCKASTSGIIDYTIQLPVVSIINAPSICGQPNGLIDINISLGTALYSFIWNNGETTEDLSNLTSGTYLLTITDAAGCTLSQSIPVSVTTSPSITSTSINSTCGIADGDIYITITGGTTPYTYLWNTGDTSQDLNNVLANTYFLTVTDVNGCIDTAIITLSCTPLIPCNISLSSTAIDAICGNSNGSIDLSVSNATGTILYNWNNGTSTQDLLNINAGNYSVTVTDANACTASIADTIIQYNAPFSLANTVSPACNQSNGSIQLTIFGGLDPLNYIWNNGATNKDLLNISEGTYDVTVTDLNGCSATLNSVLTCIDTTACNIVINNVTQNVTCPGVCNGSVNLSISSASAPYTFQWNNSSTTEDINSLCLGNYSVTVTDALGCSARDTITINSAIQINVSSSSSNDIVCNGYSNGSIQLTVNGGATPLQYNWSNGATTQSINNVSAGVYTVTITDSNGCFITATDTVNEPEPLLVFNTSSNEYCNQANGTINLNLVGGVTPYFFVWDNNSTNQNLSNVAAGSYAVTISDANNCTAITNIIVNNVNATPIVVNPTLSSVCNGFSTSINVSGAVTYSWSPSGSLNSSIGNSVVSTPQINTTYTVTGIDANGCPTLATTTISVYSAPDIVLTPMNPSICAGASAILNASGASTYEWNSNNIISTGSTITVQPSQSAIYYVQGIDAFGCVGIDSVMLTINPIPFVSASASDTSICFNSNLSLSATSNATNFLWTSNGVSLGSNQSILLNNAINTNYIVNATDANGCSASDDINVVLNNLPIINLDVSDDEICLGESTVLDYDGADSYSWSPSTGIVSSDNIITLATPLNTTTYILTGTSNNSGCSNIAQVVINVNQLPTVNISASTINACIGNDVTLSASGALQYLWTASNAVATSTGSLITYSPTELTIFTVMGTDIHSCSNYDTVTISVYNNPLAWFAPSSVEACAPFTVEFNNASLNASSFDWIVDGNIVGNDSILSYQFNAGIHSVGLIANSTGGCSDTINFNNLIEAHATPIADFSVNPGMNDFVSLDKATFNFTNLSTDAIQYQWNFGDQLTSTQINPQHTYTKEGDYKVRLIAINADECRDTIEKSYIKVVKEGDLFIPNTFSPNGDGSNDIFFVNGKGIAKVSFSIYDRWGTEVYFTDSNTPWDGNFLGKPENTSVFVYTGIVEYLSGTKVYIKGDLTLLR